MAGRNVKPGPSAFDPADKMHSNTLKRHPKMDLSRSDLLKLLSYLEGELQARDVVIATLRAEKAKQLLYQAKYGRFGLGDPFTALQRDSDNLKDNTFDELAIKSMYDNQLAQLENLIATQRKAQLKMREQLAAGEKRYQKVCNELDDERRKHAQDTAQGDDVTYMLEKERERLKQEIEFEKGQCKKMEKDLKKTLASLEEERANSAKHKQVALLLIKERKKLVEKMLQERQKYGNIEKSLNDEKNKTLNMAEGLMQESKKSLKMEATLEKQLSEFDVEREQLKSKLLREENKNKDMHSQVDSLKWQVESLQKQLMEKSSSKDMFQSIEIKSSVSGSRTTPERGGNLGRQVSSPTQSGSPGQGVGKLIPKTGTPKPLATESNVRIMSDSDRELSLSRQTNVSSPVDSSWKSVHYGSPQALVSSDRGSMQPYGAGDSHSKLEARVAPVGAASSEKAVTEVYSSPKVSVVHGSGASVVGSMPQGRIAVQVAGQSGVANAPSSPRKVPPMGRGIPPPIPPNKPVLTSPAPASSKPAPPPKVGITISKDRITMSGADSMNTSPHVTKSVQIPVNVVHTSSAGAAGSRTPKRDGSPLRKPTQVCVNAK